MPDIESAMELRSLIGLHTIHVHPCVDGDVPYAGLELGCTWEAEHGLGILMHGDRVVKIGWADTALYPLPGSVRDPGSESLIEAPKPLVAWPPVSREHGRVNSSGATLCGPNEHKSVLFVRDDLLLKG